MGRGTQILLKKIVLGNTEQTLGLADFWPWWVRTLSVSAQVGLRNAIARAAPASALKTLKYLSEGISVTNKKRKEFQHYPGKSFLFPILVIFVPALQCTVYEV